MIMSWNGFGSLDLSNTEAGSGSPRLPKGVHHVRCVNAEVLTTKTGGKMIKATLEAVDGTGEIPANFNVQNKNTQAVDIGMRQLKTFLVAANHPNPDKPEDIETLKGLECRVIVDLGKEWKGDDGTMRRSSEVKNFRPVGEASEESSGSSSKLDDDIPF